MLELLGFISSLITLYIYIIVASAVMSWLIAFNVVNPYNQFVRSIWQGLNALTEPAAAPDPAHDARPWRHRHLARCPDPDLRIHPGRDHSQHRQTGVTGARKEPWRTRTDGVQVFVRVTPKSARDCVEGTTDSAEGPALKVRVRAVADKGEANRAVEAVVAEWLGVARTSVASGRAASRASRPSTSPAIPHDLPR